MIVPALIAGAVTFFSTMAGGIAALRWPSQIESLMALAGGVVLAAALFDLLPEAVEQAEEIGMSVRVPIGVVFAGYLLFHLAERYAHRHGHEEGHAHGAGEPDPAGVVGASGFIVHSFFDGLAIGLGFQIDAGVGILVAVAVVGHDFSDGLNTVSYMLGHGHTPARSRSFLFAVALAPIAGAATASVVPLPEEVFPIALGTFSGFFIYAAATNLLPQSLALPARRAIPLTMLGAGAMLLISLLA